MDGSCLCRLMSIAEETLTEFLSKATGTAVEWVQMPGMKVGLVTSESFPVSCCFESEILLSLSCHGHLQPGPDSIGIIAISHGCAGVAARACGLVGMEPAKVSVFASLPCIPMWLGT
jgi:homeobox-leucine zipper protein